MHRQWMFALAVLLAGGIYLAQSASAEAAQVPATSPGSTLQDSTSTATQGSETQTMAIELSKSLDAKKLKPGDPVRAKITSVFRLENGRSIPIGSTVQGHVTQAATRSKEVRESSLGIAFDSVVLKDGQQLPLKATIQAVAAPPEWPITNPGNGNQGMGQPPVMGPGTSTNPPGAPYPGPGSSPVGGYPQAPSVPGQPTSGQRDTGDAASLTPQSTGVIGMRNVSLQSNSLLTSTEKDLKLESGTAMILRVQNQ